jgi:23S rRNA (cytidine1920-2'-O)/16S rRNA (cytidine1409-2'-O)-methyltransferase
VVRPRSDVALTEAGYFPSREKAKAAILAGEVKVGEARLTKPGVPLPAGEVTVAESPRYVSRGGVKLAGALDVFGVEVTGLRCIDVGASTGGFTDALLQRGAAEVTAVDVGYGQLAWSLRCDRRVRVFERTNIRDADPAVLGTGFDLAVVDVSFIGLAKVLPAVRALLGGKAEVIALVKPQFEAGKGRVGKKGVVRDAAVHAEVLRAVEDVAHGLGWVVRGLTWSPITGPEGNIEFWIRLAPEGEETSSTPEEVVREAHEMLEG